MNMEMATGTITPLETRLEARMYQLPCCGSLAVAIPKMGA